MIASTTDMIAKIEDDFMDASDNNSRNDWSLAVPVAAMRTVSHDPSCRATIELADGSRMTAIELQWEFLRLAQKYADETGLEACGEAVGNQVLTRWESVLGALERDPRSLDGQLDWVTKLGLLDAYVDRDALSGDDPKLALLDLQYHDVRPYPPLYERP